MSFEIRSTINGPLILWNDEIVFMVDEDSIIGVCEDNPDFFDAMRLHIQSELMYLMQEFVGAVEVNMNPTPTKLYAYLSASQHFWVLKNHRWPMYLASLKEAEEEE